MTLSGKRWEGMDDFTISITLQDGRVIVVQPGTDIFYSSDGTITIGMHPEEEE